MKYLISESKLDSLITDYLKRNYEPDYGWGPDLFNYYKNDSERYGYVEFTIDDRQGYIFSKVEDKLYDAEPNSLIIRDWVADNLHNIFGNLWKPVFVKWFIKNTDLPVEHLVISYM